MTLYKIIVSAFFLQASTNALSQQPALIRSNTEKEFIPEGIAIDSRSGKVYVSSIDRHKIVTIDEKGVARDFIKANQDGFLEGLGLKVDEKHDWLWALSVLREGNTFHSKIHAFDLATGATQQQYSIKDTIPHLFNDLAIAPDGKLFITDTYFSALYTYDPITRQLEIFSKDPLIKYPNGLAFGKNKLYIATYGSGVIAFDTTTKKAEKLAGISDTTISFGLDGLVHLDNKLYGVYNIAKDPKDNCIIRYDLSPSGDRVVGQEVIDAGHPAFAMPTTAALFKQKLYVIANSHLDVFNANKTSTRGIEFKLGPVVLLVYDL